VTGSGFQAKWSIPFLGRNYPQAWKPDNDKIKAVEASRFGVELVNPISQYHMVDRSLKYAFFFIFITFAAVWLMETLVGLQVNPIQYLLLGAALCLFYLLELSLSEHLGFPTAYALASVAVVGMVAAYSMVALRSRAHGLLVGAGVIMLYIYLYVMLTNEDYALLIGSLGLFGILAVIMYATRHVDWYALSTRK